MIGARFARTDHGRRLGPGAPPAGLPTEAGPFQGHGVDPAGLADRVRLLEHLRYAAALAERPSLFDEAADHLRSKPDLSPGECLWLAMLARHRRSLPWLLVSAEPEARFLRASSPLPALLGAPSASEAAALLEEARTGLEKDARTRAGIAAGRVPPGPRVACFLDFEASSLSDASYPLEVGWAWVFADGQIESGGRLIAPEPHWTDWSVEAEAVHRIPREMAEALGRPAAEVADLLDELLAGGVVYSDAPGREAQWADRLYQAAGRKRRWRIGDASAVIQALVHSEDDRVYWRWKREAPRVHRAESDAWQLAHAFAQLRAEACRRSRP